MKWFKPSNSSPRLEESTTSYLEKHQKIINDGVRNGKEQTDILKKIQSKLAQSLEETDHNIELYKNIFNTSDILPVSDFAKKKRG